MKIRSLLEVFLWSTKRSLFAQIFDFFSRHIFSLKFAENAGSSKNELLSFFAMKRLIYFKIVNYSNRQLLSSHTHIAQATQAKNSLDLAWLLKDQPPNFYAPQYKKNWISKLVPRPRTFFPIAPSLLGRANYLGLLAHLHTTPHRHDNSAELPCKFGYLKNIFFAEIWCSRLLVEPNIWPRIEEIG